MPFEALVSATFVTTRVAARPTSRPAAMAIVNRITAFPFQKPTLRTVARSLSNWVVTLRDCNEFYLA